MRPVCAAVSLATFQYNITPGLCYNELMTVPQHSVNQCDCCFSLALSAVVAYGVFVGKAAQTQYGIGKSFKSWP